LDNLDSIYQAIQVNIKTENIKNGVEDYEMDEKENNTDGKNWFDKLSDDQKAEIKNELKNSLKEKDFQKTLNGINKYTEVRQKKCKSCIWCVWFQKGCGNRTKYSLAEEQTIILQNLTLAVIIGVEAPETFGRR